VLEAQVTPPTTTINIDIDLNTITIVFNRKSITDGFPTGFGLSSPLDFFPYFQPKMSANVSSGRSFH